MKFLVLSLLLAALPKAGAAELKDVRSVYLYPMMGGLDQHLANQLTRDHVFRVVADPKLADALFTDQLGRPFEYRMDHIKRDIAAPVTAMPAASSPAASGPATTPTALATTSTPAAPVSAATTLPTVSGQQSDAEPHSSSFSRGKGTIFLVDAKSRQVVWSDYRQPGNSSPRQLEKMAKQMVSSLNKVLNPQSKTAQ
ncbi:MAG: hypothetical protein M3Z09_14410 [Acidobacteriota bacterium]|nr:hypothetical protein [Acidobacteriota bacterium]